MPDNERCTAPEPTDGPHAAHSWWTPRGGGFETCPGVKDPNQIGPDREQFDDHEPWMTSTSAKRRREEKEWSAGVEHDLRNATLGEFQIYREVRESLRKEREDS